MFVDTLLSAFVFPLGLAIVACGISLLAIWRGRARPGLVGGAASLAALWICSTPLFAGFAARALEARHPPLRLDETPRAEVAIVLGGGVHAPRSGNPYYDIDESADRVLHAVRLLKAGKVERILVTGGGRLWRPGEGSEGEATAQLLDDLSVPSDAVLVEAESRNTYENALYSKTIWDDREFTTGLLVTSALHMERALGVFRQQGFTVVPASTDARGDRMRLPFPLSVLPDVGALSTTTSVVKEIVGLLVYRIRGWA